MAPKSKTPKRKAPEALAPKRKAPEAPPSYSSDNEEEELEVEKSSHKKPQNPECSDSGSDAEAEGAPRSGRSDPKGESSSGKLLFQRVWAVEDEAAILRGMIEFFEKEGRNPAADVAGFLEYMKGKLSVEPEPEQLRTKMTNSKRKFSRYDRSVKAGEALKDRQQEVYELGKVLWRAGDGLCAPKNSDPPASAVWSDYVAATCRFARKRGADDAFLMAGLEGIKAQKRDELAGKWKKLQLEQMQVISTEALLIHDLVNRAIRGHEKGSA